MASTWVRIRNTIEGIAVFGAKYVFPVAASFAATAGFPPWAGVLIVNIIPALMAALKDRDVCVRMMSANALAAIGKGAAPSAPALIAAGSVKDEQVHVLRAVAAALGGIGKPAATPALPLLRELAKIPRVCWAAESAIRKIE